MKFGKRFDILGLILVIFAVGFFYSTVAQILEPFTFGEDHGSYYPLMTDSLLAGRLDLLVRPAPQLLALSDPYDPNQNVVYRLFHDASLYKGRYYLNYGIVPAATLFIPYRLIFDRNMSESFGVFCESLIAFLFFILLLVRIRARAKPKPPLGALLLGAALFGMTTGIPITMARPLFYEITTAGALMWTMGALFFFYESFYPKEKNWIYLALGSSCLGLAVGTRPAFGLLVVILIWLFWRLRKENLWSGSFLKEALVVFAPWCLIVGALALYNYLRFHNPFENGMSYSLLGHSHDVTFFSPKRYVDNFIAYFFEPPSYDGTFPFLKIGENPLPPLIVNPQDMKVFPTVGILFFCPFAVFECGHQIFRRIFRKKTTQEKIPLPLRWIMQACLLAFALMFLMMGGFIGVAIRYVVDFFPYLLAFLIINWMLDQNFNGHRKISAWISVCLAAVSIIGSFFISFSPKLQKDSFQWVVETLTKQDPPDEKAFEAAVGYAKHYYATLETSMGAIKCLLYNEEAPRTVQNFIKLAEGHQQWLDVKTNSPSTAPFYDGMPFYAVDSDMMIETGDQLGTGFGGPGYSLPQEWRPRRHFGHPGQLVMTTSRSAVGSQFFITTRPTPWLEFSNTVFGEVIEGMDVVKKISQVPVDENLRPLTPVILKKVSIIRD